MTSADDSLNTSRRGFLGLAAGLCAAAALGATNLVALTDAEAATGVTQLTDGRLKVTVSKIRALQQTGHPVAIGNVRGQTPVALIRTGTNKFLAIDLRCPHAGVTVKVNGSGWKCPAHSSKFTASGTYISGPAGTGLASVKTSYSNGVVTVG